MKRSSPFASGIAINCSFLLVSPASSQSIVVPIDQQATTNEFSDDRADERLIKYMHQILQENLMISMYMVKSHRRFLVQ